MPTPSAGWTTKSSHDPKIPKKTTVFVGMRTSTDPSGTPKRRGKNPRRLGETDKEYHARWARDWRAANPDRRNETAYRWRLNNPAKFKASQKASKKRRLEREPDYDRNKQRRYHRLPNPTRPCPDLCEGCGRLEPRIHKCSGKRFSLCLDHCHITGRFRGWLYSVCNTTAGKYNDDYKLIEKLAEYLKNGSFSGH